ncbi:RICIN domain-containing protein [Actinoplanes sp. NPDC049596]|uniref:RICIN domain-containing protein n=1 Tax=unclassified Actinoplanes TaxID=2626549 RepID=UPI00343AFF8C
MTDTPDREDPVLVRPYVSTSVDTTEFTAVEDAETWPEPGEGDTAAHPVVAEPAPEEPPKKPKRTDNPVLRLVIFCGGVALALGVAAFLVFGPGTDPKLPQPGAALPAMPAQPPIPESSVAAASKSAAAAAASASASLSASASVSASVTPSLSVSGSQQALVPVVTPPSASSNAPAATPTATTTTAAPTDRTGAITAASGRCLARGGLLGLDGSPVNVAGCSGGDTQTFTLAADGTLHVDGRCAAAGSDGTVRVGSCENAAAWSTGEGGTLVASNGQCLTDPGRSGAATKVTACSGASEQTWTLP